MVSQLELVNAVAECTAFLVGHLVFLTIVCTYCLFYPKRNVLCEVLTIFGVTCIVPLPGHEPIACLPSLVSQYLCYFCPCSISHWFTVKLTRTSCLFKTSYFERFKKKKTSSLKPRSLYPMPKCLSFSPLGTRTLCRLSSKRYSGSHWNALRQVGRSEMVGCLHHWENHVI